MYNMNDYYSVNISALQRRPGKVTEKIKLINAIESNDCDEINRLLTRNASLMYESFENHNRKRILKIALQDFVKEINVETITALLKYDSRNEVSYQPFQKTLLELVTKHNRNDLLEAVIKIKPNLFRGNGNNLLHTLIEDEDTNSYDQKVKECVSLLLNTTLQEDKVTVNDLGTLNKPAILLAAEKKYYHIVKAILGSNQGKDVIIDGDFNDNGKTAREVILENGWHDLELSKYDKKYDLFKYVHKRDEINFLSYNGGDISKWADSDNSRETILQKICKKNLIEATKHILNNGADPCHTLPNTLLPIQIALVEDYNEILEILVNRYKCKKIKIPSDVICCILESRAHFSSMDLIAKYPELIKVNERSKKKDITILGAALKYSNDKNVKRMLDFGASLAVRGISINLMNPDILESRLDDCVEFDEANNKIVFNLETLIPPTEEPSFCESDVIYSMSQSVQHRYLLKHPIISTFLTIKWNTFKTLFNMNFLLYFLFTCSLVLYVFQSYGHYENAKYWHRIAVMLIMYVLVMCKEIFNAIASNLYNYISKFKNIITILLFFFATLIFFPNLNKTLRKECASFSILFGTFVMVIMSGQHPQFSINLIVLKRVTLNFISLLLWYLFVLMGLSLSFFIMYCNIADDQNNFIQLIHWLFQSINDWIGTNDQNLSGLNIVLNRIIFLMYICMLLFVLISFLITLAISITPKFQNESELVRLIAIASYVNHVEKIFKKYYKLVPSFIRRKHNLNFFTSISVNRNGWIEINKLYLNQKIMSTAEWILKQKNSTELDTQIMNKFMREMQTYWHRKK